MAKRFEVRTQNQILDTETFRGFAAQISPICSTSDRLALRTPDPLLFCAVLLFALERDLNLVLFREAFSEDFLQDRVKNLNIHLVVTGTLKNPGFVRTKQAPAPPETKGVGIFTSGTTGPAKLAWHSWSNVQDSSFRVPDRLKGKRWLLTYDLAAYAGLQVIFGALNNEGVLIHLGSRVTDHPRGIVGERIQVISATPTYWRLLINSWPAALQPPELLQATLGGEVIHQDILTSVQKFFRPQKLTHIYASTEAGTAIVVSDGLEGFPVRWLEESRDTAIRVRDGQLEIRSARGMQGYASEGEQAVAKARDAWYTTPDRIEVRGERVYFMGRSDRTVNVAGAKINPEEIEQFLNAMPGVADSYVYGRPNPITGMVLCADVMPEKETRLTPDDLKANLRNGLSRIQIPRIINIVDEIQFSTNGKKYR